MIKDKPREDDIRTASGRPSSWLNEKPLSDALRQAYQDVLNEPVPERLQNLLDEIRELSARHEQATKAR